MFFFTDLVHKPRQTASIEGKIKKQISFIKYWNFTLSSLYAKNLGIIRDKKNYRTAASITLYILTLFPNIQGVY